jgi:hypothetical protein
MLVPDKISYHGVQQDVRTLYLRCILTTPDESHAHSFRGHLRQELN